MRIPECCLKFVILHLMSVQGFVIFEYMTGPKGNLQCDLSLALKVHGGAVGYSSQDISLVLPGGLDRRPDVAFWAVRPTREQRSHRILPAPCALLPICGLRFVISQNISVYLH